MPVDQESISRRLYELIQLAQSKQIREIGEVTSGTISILEMLYGANSEKLKAYNLLFQNYVRNPERASDNWIKSNMLSESLGFLKSIESEVEAGLVGNIELQTQGGIFGDFITVSVHYISSN